MAAIPGIMTVSEVAEFMRVSRETVYRLATRGELPGRKIGRIWRFQKVAIQKYLGGEADSEHTGRTGRGRESGDVPSDDVDPSNEQPCPGEPTERTPGLGNPRATIHRRID